MRFIAISIVCVFWKPTLSALDKSFAGPFEFIMDRVDRCLDQGTNEIDIHNYVVHKLNRTSLGFSSQVDVKREIGVNDLRVDVNIAVWGNGGWKANYFVQSFNNPCNFFQTLLPKYSAAVLKNANISSDCHIQVGTYEFKDLVVEPDIQAKVLPYNRYKAMFKLYANNTFIGCILAFIEVKPKSVKPSKQ